jgi:nucleoside-diphosphate-sugar epimerase
MLRTAFVTGGTGTVGSAVVQRLLRAGVMVRALVRSRDARVAGAELVVGDLGDADALARAAFGADVVIHCAAALSDDPDECRRINVEGTQHVVDAALAARARLIHLSTVSAYDDEHGTDFDEDSPLWTGPPEDYGRSKAEGERVVRTREDRGLIAVILRPAVVLSMHPRSYWGPLAVERARNAPGALVPLSEVPYVHVTNLAEAVWLACTRAEAGGRAYNVIDGNGPAQEYVDAVYAAIGRPPPRLPADAPRIRYAGERIRQELGYSPTPLWREFLGELRAQPRAY